MCNDNEHNYQPVSESNYYKRVSDSGAFGLPKHDQSVSYKMLMCTKCGHTKEVIAQDHRIPEEEEKP